MEDISLQHYCCWSNVQTTGTKEPLVLVYGLSKRRTRVPVFFFHRSLVLDGAIREI